MKVEQRIHQVLNDRLHLFQSTVGNLDPILGEFEDDIRRISLEHGADFHREVERLERDLTERVREAQLADEMLGDFIMDARSYRRDAVNALLGRTDVASWPKRCLNGREAEGFWCTTWWSLPECAPARR